LKNNWNDNVGARIPRPTALVMGAGRGYLPQGGEKGASTLSSHLFLKDLMDPLSPRT